MQHVLSTKNKQICIEIIAKYIGKDSKWLTVSLELLDKKENNIVLISNHISSSLHVYSDWYNNDHVIHGPGEFLKLLYVKNVF